MYIKKMNKAYAQEIMQWKYEAPYELYNLEGDKEKMDKIIDIGMGMKPEWTGQGLGENFFPLSFNICKSNSSPKPSG